MTDKSTLAMQTKLIPFDKTQLQLINRRTLRYGLVDAEKDYFLAIVSQFIFESPLKDKIVFKGGTALHHCYLDQLRFSEDLDFTSLERNITVEEIKQVLESVEFLAVKKEFVSRATVKIEKLQYIGPLQQPNSLKVEIDFIQNVILPVKEMEYKNVWGLSVRVNAMDLREICAEKIRAMSDRFRYRDFYDFYQILKNFDINLEEIVELVKKKEIRKPISKQKIMENWQVVRLDKQAEYSSVYYKEDVPDEEIEKAIQKLAFDELPRNSKFQEE
ncbi:MAG: nucleotidyl transferase AbiEii/AbiGii toxin family protein [Candidatus Daviesbacteria bacterium]|nr:nucleotidyl transferase AbiEii/AbiGii toxin family protein [Candidatus Daviesbacteria bacterium]